MHQQSQFIHQILTRYAKHQIIYQIVLKLLNISKVLNQFKQQDWSNWSCCLTLKKKSSTSSTLRERRWSTSSCQGLLLSSSHLRWCWKAAETFCQKNGALQAGVGSKLPPFPPRFVRNPVTNSRNYFPLPWQGAAVEKSGIPHFCQKLKIVPGLG